MPNFSLQNPSKNQPLASPTWRGLTSIDSQQGQCSTHAKVQGIVPRVEWHCSGDSSAANDHLGAPGSTPLYVCLPPIRGSEGGDYYFCITLTKKNTK